MAQEVDLDNVTEAPAAPAATEAPAEAPAEGEVPNITAGDLVTMVRIIDAGSTRGAWKGDELSVIGALRNKLAVIVQAVAPQTEEAAEGEQAESNEA